ncbi:hypothetical protein CC77DRAFT_1004091 [Alternaria alternata]|jgi:hypothetical protein|uniref:Uncharacterized protein n=1 Tax=Alternaria alternata TaxID=5599 RepID=A0A177E4Z8_ALTAL|nr:hypothetical protein CC77DRAFT_1004091 [Alternaria alternata]XP_051593489.1 uncharacterized protein J4E82_000744 [Alternaria postmessia]RII23373.1 hypothetical protein CUC08_Gglean012195 [Alternaria sp. MG1]RYN65146.1 hypothetical protein AA0118_g3427 [Alternaria tenuissima]KAH6852300.1 hypothetical protein B0T12DRAFT_395476 [Alternaria alternata]KAI5380786.1 hypothetical protein J4E82_000744 [Alternaria postmessia]OAG26069.1 hypothetical protein CC77DRAFT_1004091 [Alternaria alternata]
MFNKHTTTLLAATLLPLASAYQLTFYAGFDCNGERLETRQADQDGTCYDAEYLGGNTNSVNIIKEVGDDPNSIVAFYPRDVDCRPGDSISAGNTGCVNVYQDDQFFGGYNVISGEFKRRDVQEEAPAEPKSALGITHGDFFELDGELWRWKQIALDAFSGVKPEDWAGEVRVASFAPLEFSRDYPFNFTEYDLKHPSSTPQERAIVADARDEPGFSPVQSSELAELVPRQRDICRRVRDCVYGFPILANFYFPAQTEAVVNMVNAAKPAAQSIWRFLNNPYIANFPTGIATGAIGMYFSGTAPGCSPNDESEAVRTTINEGTTASSRVSACSTEVYGNPGYPGTLSTVIVPPEQRGTGICNTPVTDPSPGRFALSRHKRALYSNVPGFEEWVKTKDFSI